jgi:expansin (peptidoglycan-binding protein)
MSTTDAKKPTKARQPRAFALTSTASRKTTKLKTPVNGFATAYASKYTVGDHISHPIFGHGTVTAIDENKLTIEFPKSVTKQIIDSYVTRRNP